MRMRMLWVLALTGVFLGCELVYDTDKLVPDLDGGSCDPSCANLSCGERNACGAICECPDAETPGTDAQVPPDAGPEPRPDAGTRPDLDAGCLQTCGQNSCGQTACGVPCPCGDDGGGPADACVDTCTSGDCGKIVCGIVCSACPSVDGGSIVPHDAGTCAPLACPVGNCGTMDDGCGGVTTCTAFCVFPDVCGAVVPNNCAPATDSVKERMPDSATQTCMQPDMNSTVSCASAIPAKQDGNFLNPAPAFSPQDGGTVVDAVTNLEWWAPGTSAKTQQAAAQYCETHAAGTKAGWRLPTTAELTTLFDFGKVAPPMLNGPVASGNAAFWSSIPAGASGWYADFNIGTIATMPATNLMPVLCVRPLGGAATAAPGGRYATSSGGAVTDTVTGLTWLVPNVGSQGWEAAFNTCASQTPYGAWRVANIKEIATLVDRTAASGYSSAGVFLPGLSYWSSTPFVHGFTPPSAYAYFPDLGQFQPTDVANSSAAICVQGP